MQSKPQFMEDKQFHDAINTTGGLYPDREKLEKGKLWTACRIQFATIQIIQDTSDEERDILNIQEIRIQEIKIPKGSKIYEKTGSKRDKNIRNQDHLHRDRRCLHNRLLHSPLLLSVLIIRSTSKKGNT